MKLKSILGSLLALFLLAGTASALPFNTTSGLSFNNTLHDTSAEYLVNKDGSAGDDVTVDEGDYLIGDLNIHEINDDDIGAGSGWPELTAHFILEVATKTGNSTNGWDYTFKSTITDTNDSDYNAMAWFYEDSSVDQTFTDPSTFSNGNLWASFGLTDSDTYWTAWTKTDDIVELNQILNDDPSAQPSDVGYFGFHLDVITNNSSLTFKDVGTTETELTGAGHFQAKDVGYSDQYHVGDQANMNINVVPEPASFALFGIGLIGLAGLARRRGRG